MSYSQSRIGPRSQLGSIHREPATPKTPISPAIEQLLQGHDGSKWSPRHLQIGKGHDMEEDYSPNQRKSVMARVKEKAKKWRLTLSKKKLNEDAVATPRWALSLDDKDDQDEIENPEYFGAPMYESEKAPEGYREKARQHPRTIPVISEKHILTSSVNFAKSVRTTRSLRYANRTTTNTTTSMPITPKSAPATMSTAMAEKPEHQSFSVSALEPRKNPPGRTSSPAKSSLSTHPLISLEPRKNSCGRTSSPAKSSLSTYPLMKTSSAQAKSSDPATPSLRSGSPQALAPVATKKQEVTQAEPERPAPVSAPAAIGTSDNHGSPTGQIWDKGVSVKEYLMHKLVPGEDEKALSRVISQAISPRKNPGDVSVVDKFKEAVSSLIWNNASSQVQQQHLVFHSAQSSLSNINPISTDAHEVTEEENHGRVLQAN